MSHGETPDEPDRLQGAPHPRETASLYGQEAAEAAFLAALATGRPHHGWIIAGPRGVGKATLAWRIARHMVAGGTGGSLAMDPADPVFRQIASGASPQVALCRRGRDERTAGCAPRSASTRSGRCAASSRSAPPTPAGAWRSSTRPTR
jgi:DNA polymerase III subunit delta'